MPRHRARLEEFLFYTKRSHSDLNRWVTSGTKIRPGIPSNKRISSQFDSNILQLFGISGWILVPQWLNFLGQNDYIFSLTEMPGNGARLEEFLFFSEQFYAANLSLLTN